MARSKDSIGTDAGVRAAVFLLFFISGAAALVYEVVWTRKLTLILGASAPAVGAVLAVFMAGLGAGAALGGRACGKFGLAGARAMRGYAALEAAVALLGFASPYLLDFLPILYIPARRVLEPGLLLTLARAAIAAAALLPATLCMGATLPILVAAFAGGGRDRERGRAFGRDVGFLYGLNTLGAFAGILVSAFYLIDTFGVRGAAWSAACANATIAAAALLAARGLRALPAAPAAVPAPAPALQPSERRAALCAFFMSGFSALACEVLWHRYLIYSVGDNSVYAFAQMLATFLFGLALGAAAGGLASARLRPRLLTIGIVQLLAGISILCGIYAFSNRGRGAFMELPEGGVRDFAGICWFGFRECLKVELAPTLLFGAMFPLVAQWTAESGAAESTGRAGAWNTAGAIGGAVAGGFYLLPQFGLQGGLIAAGFVCMLGACGCIAFDAGLLRARKIVYIMIAAGAAAAAGAIASRAPSPASGAVLAEPAVQEIAAYADGASSSVAIVRNKRTGYYTIVVDGDGQAGDRPSAMLHLRMLGHLPVLYHPDPKRALVIGFGAGITAGSVAAHPGLRVDICELSSRVVELARIFKNSNGGVHDRSNVHITIDDGRNFLLAAREPYDVITTDPIDPDDAGVTSLYCKEFYRMEFDALAPGGVAAQWIPGGYSEEMYKTLIESFRSVFPDCYLYDADFTQVIVGRKPGGAPLLYDRFARAFAGEPGFEEARASLSEVGLDSTEDLLSLQLAGPAELARLCAGARVNSDDRPLIEYRGPRGYNRSPDTLEAFFAPGVAAGAHDPARDAMIQKRLDLALGMRNTDRAPLFADWSAEREKKLSPIFEAVSRVMRSRVDATRAALGVADETTKNPRGGTAAGTRMLELLKLPAPRVVDIFAGFQTPEFGPSGPGAGFITQYDRAVELFTNREFDESLRIFQSLETTNPNSPRAILGTAYSLLALHDAPAAAGCAFRLLKNGAGSDAALLTFVESAMRTLAIAAGTRSRREEALALLRQWTGASPGDTAEAWRRWWQEHRGRLRFDFDARKFVAK
ncbi:MAG: fused MFS/spermidine synthase [Planctomycetes bacterium]|nr:fused MFS/spermidine synthase [Planctomycetota bacterium]